MSEPIVALAVGVLLGPAVLNWLALAYWAIRTASWNRGPRVAIAIQLTAVALRISRKYPSEQ
ncbi:hypothetical protein [Pseudanabaena sp. FACHB-2040]|uniref:hypothetical protein n=1 Tax=Pseudanabaena sp. FACHB-2040 TaxID=2692859 RepID=UPI001682EA9F|nr:hypothetical protein [Pseudanabaena sp. FACHB-2040]MBD2261164.1 hypothetical protein [Pseudanabaena sp. FACHB-2040]